MCVRIHVRGYPGFPRQGRCQAQRWGPQPNFIPKNRMKIFEPTWGVGGGGGRVSLLPPPLDAPMLVLTHIYVSLWYNLPIDLAILLMVINIHVVYALKN